jgi:hypothetical protein
MSARETQNDQAKGIETEIGAESRQLFEKIMEQWRTIAAIAGAIVVTVAAYSGYGAYQEHRLTKAEHALEQAMLENQGTQRLAALEGLRDALPNSLLPRYWLEMAKAAQEQQDWTRALEFWSRLAQDGPENWSVLARLGQAASMLRLGQAREALDVLELLSVQAPESMHSVVRLQLAEAAEQAEDWERALAAYEQLKTSEDSPQAGFLEYKTSQIRERLEAGNS